jgi:L-lactate permease
LLSHNFELQSQSSVCSYCTIVVATAAVGRPGREGDLFRKVLSHSRALASLVGLIVFFFASMGRAWIP